MRDWNKKKTGFVRVVRCFAALVQDLNICAEINVCVGVGVFLSDPSL